MIVVGASGYIGKPLYVRAMIGSVGYGTSSTGADNLLRLRLDKSDAFDYGIIHSSDVVLLTAAISAPDICVREHERAWNVNVAGTSEFITQVMAREGRIVFFSSDTVYGEREDEFEEHTISNPVGEYAEMKDEVEKRFLGSPLFKSIRLSYVFSREDKFTQYLSGCAEQGEEAEIFHPFYRAIIHRDDVVEGAIALAKRWDEFPQSVINFGGPEVLARTAFVQTLKEVSLPRLRYRVTEPGADFFANRPKVICMKSPLLESLLGRPAHTLRQSCGLEFNMKEEKGHV